MDNKDIDKLTDRILSFEEIDKLATNLDSIERARELKNQGGSIVSVSAVLGLYIGGAISFALELPNYIMWGLIVVVGIVVYKLLKVIIYWLFHI